MTYQIRAQLRKQILKTTFKTKIKVELRGLNIESYKAHQISINQIYKSQN